MGRLANNPKEDHSLLISGFFSYNAPPLCAQAMPGPHCIGQLELGLREPGPQCTVAVNKKLSKPIWAHCLLTDRICGHV